MVRFFGMVYAVHGIALQLIGDGGYGSIDRLANCAERVPFLAQRKNFIAITF